MSSYINIETLEYPLYEGDIRLEYSDIPPHLTGDTFPATEKFAKVTMLALPEYDAGAAYVKLGEPYEENGLWYVAWSDPIPYTQDELQAIQERLSARFKNQTPSQQPLDVPGEAPDVIG